MGMLGAFVFAAQMINFGIPGTGSSGHLGGGAAAGHPARAACGLRRRGVGADGAGPVLRRRRPAGPGRQHVQPGRAALLSGLSAGLPPAGRQVAVAAARLAIAAVVAAVLGLQLGALAVVLQTVASGISSLPVPAFLGLMLPIHLAIGVVEGLATAALRALPAPRAARVARPAGRRRLPGGGRCSRRWPGGRRSPAASCPGSHRPSPTGWSGRWRRAAATAPCGAHRRRACTPPWMPCSSSLAWLPGYALAPTAARPAPAQRSRPGPR